MTSEIDRVYSPATCSAIMSGRKTRMVVNVDVRRCRRFKRGLATGNPDPGDQRPGDSSCD